jgi:hypothetical protein
MKAGIISRPVSLSMKYAKSYSIILVGLFALVFDLKAQHQEIGEKPASWQGNESNSVDSASVLHAFKSGNFEGHLRYFFSLTDNNGQLSDYYANAAGGGIRYETGRFHGFQFGVSGFFIFNVGSSDLTLKDSLTNQSNRYELGLFDIEDPGNKKDIDRLEEFYLKYNLGKSWLKFGRQLINSPFVNLQDGRMRPTGVEGLWFELNDIKKFKFEGGWLYAISPRSTVKWYEADESVGLYPSGVTALGNRSDYAGNIQSAGVFTAGAKWQPHKSISLKVWDLYFEDVLNAFLSQVDLKREISESLTISGALQYIRQDALNDGGNEDPLKAYIDEGAQANAFGGRFGVQLENTAVTLNYTHITDDGRYLMPREWGRDPFFTFMPRERNEGFGDLNAYTISISKNFPDQRVKSSLTAGYFDLPDIRNYRLNKYGMPSYLQFNADIRYAFQGMLKGLDAQLLAVAKINQGELYGDVRSEFNKVNMELYNLVLNYHF